MNTLRPYNPRHSTPARSAHKLLIVAALVVVPTASGQDAVALRDELTRLLQTEGPEAAVAHAQAALDAHPDDPGVRSEYVTLHLSLARTWLRQRKYPASDAALAAILDIQPAHAEARRLRDALRAARQRAAAANPAEIERLLRLELFEPALDLIRQTRQLRPDLATALTRAERAAWLGAADDHYLARNFREASALYENLLAREDAPPDVSTRWGIALALALTEDERPQPLSRPTAERLLARAADVLGGGGDLELHRILAGLLAERSGQLNEAGRLYADALRVPWQMPPADRRRQLVTELRDDAIARLRSRYETTPTGRRDGPWAVALPGVWKHRRTNRFDVYARNDLVAALVAEALEYHAEGIARWIGVESESEPRWEPRCELRVYATLAELHEATDTGGVTRAVSHTRVQGGRVLSRDIAVSQDDPWLLNSTLPHELTHVLLARALPAGRLPLAIDEGLALQAEPAARRLQFRRLLDTPVPGASSILAVEQLPADPLQFYARCDALTDLLLTRAPALPTPRDEADGATPTPVLRVLAAFREGTPPNWWQAFGWSDRRDMSTAWRAWHTRRGNPPRMPLMILGQPTSQTSHANGG